MTGCPDKDDAERITEISQLKGGRISVLIGSSFAKTVKQDSRLEGAELVYSATNADSLAELFAGKVDALVTDNTVAQQIVMMQKGLCILDETLDQAGYGIAFQKGSSLAAEFNAAIAEMKADGTLAALEEKWLGSGSTKTPVSASGSGEKGTLRCCVSADYEPIIYKGNNGELLGIDIDLSIEIANRLGYKIEFYETDFYDLIPTLEAKDADFSVSGITITEERLEVVDFSDSYMSADTVLVVMDGSATEVDSFIVTVKNSLKKTFVEEDRWKLLLSGLGTTLILLVTSVAVGLVLGILIFLGVYLGKPLLKKILLKIADIMELLPLSTWILLVFYVIFSGRSTGNTFACIVALGVMFGFSVFDVLETNVNGVDAGQVDAAASMGYSRFDALVKIILPQVAQSCISDLSYEIKGHVRSTSLVGYASVMDIQTAADIIRTETYGAFTPLILTAVVYISLSAICGKLVSCIKIGSVQRRQDPDEIKARLMRGKL